MAKETVKARSRSNTEPATSANARVRSNNDMNAKDGVNVNFNRQNLTETRKWMQELRLMFREVRIFFGFGKSKKQ